MLDHIIGKLVGAGRASHVSLKVVVFDDDDFDYAKIIHKRYPEISFYLQAGNDDIMEKDVAALREKLLAKLDWLVEKVAQSNELNDVRVLPQLHALLWGNKRGV